MARSMADSSIAYGGVLNLFVPDVLPNDTAIRRVAQVCLLVFSDQLDLTGLLLIFNY